MSSEQWLLKDVVNEVQLLRSAVKNLHREAMEPTRNKVSWDFKEPAPEVYENRLVSPQEWSPPRYLRSEAKTRDCQVYITKITEPYVRAGQDLKALITDSQISMNATFLSLGPRTQSDATFKSLLKTLGPGIAATVVLKKYRYSILGACRKSSKAGITYDQQQRLAFGALRGGPSTQSHKPGCGKYSIPAEICSYRKPGELMAKQADVFLEVEDFEIVGYSRRVFGPNELRTIASITELMQKIKIFPVVPITVPLVAQWTRNVIEGLVKIWFTELAWRKFYQSLSAEDRRHLGEIKFIFKEYNELDSAEAARAIKKLKKEDFQAMYETKGPATRLLDIRRTYIFLQHHLSKRQSRKLVAYIPGTRRPLPKSKSHSPKEGRSIKEPSTQLFATQFPPLYTQPDFPTQKSSSVDTDRISRAVSKFRFEVTDTDIKSFHALFRELYTGIYRHDIYESDDEEDMFSLETYIVEFYASQILKAAKIVKTTTPAARQTSSTKKQQKEPKLLVDEPIQPKETSTGQTPSSSIRKENKKKKRGLVDISFLNKAMESFNSTPQTPPSTDSKPPSSVSSSMSTVRASGLKRPTNQPATTSKPLQPAHLSPELSLEPKRKSSNIDPAKHRESPLLVPRAKIDRTPRVSDDISIDESHKPLPKRRSIESKEYQAQKRDSSYSTPIRRNQFPGVSIPKSLRGPLQTMPIDVEPRKQVYAEGRKDTAKQKTPKLREKTPELVPMQVDEKEEEKVLKETQIKQEPVEDEGFQTVDDANAMDFQAEEPTDLASRISALLNKIRIEEAQEKVLPERAKIPEEQASILATHGALYPRPKKLLEEPEEPEKVEKEEKREPEKQRLRFPADFMPHNDPIESSTIPRQTQDHKPDVAQSKGEQHVFTLTNTVDDGDGEGAENFDWSPTPPERLNQRSTTDFGQADYELPSEAESVIDHIPPPMSSAPADESDIPPSIKAKGKVVAGSSDQTEPAAPRKSPPRARATVFHNAFESDEPTSSSENVQYTPQVIETSTQSNRIASPSSPRQSQPSESNPRKREVGVGVSSSSRGTLRTSSNSDGEEKDAMEEDEDSDEEDEEGEEDEVQVLRTPSQRVKFSIPNREDDDDDDQKIPASSRFVSSSTQENLSNRKTNDSQQEDEDEEEDEDSSSSSGQVTPTSSPSSKTKRKADEISQSPSKAGSMRSPMIQRVKSVKLDESDKVFRDIHKELNQVKDKDMLRRKLNISPAELGNSQNLSQVMEKMRREKEALLGKRSARSSEPSDPPSANQ